MKFINYGSIESFRSIVKYMDDNPELNRNVVAEGTEKIHGTNAAVCYNDIDNIWVQSRNRIITIENDNAGCARFVENNLTAWLEIINLLKKFYNLNLTDNVLSIYFEWCGGNIQKHSCVSGLDKMAIIFKHFCVTSNDNIKWYETKCDDNWVGNRLCNIYNIKWFPSITLNIDFSNLSKSMEEMNDYTLYIEKNSGVAKFFNIPTNIGEGYVWTFFDSNNNLIRWKTKGVEHTKCKIIKKKIKNLQNSSDKEKIIADFVNYSVTDGRLQQAWQNIFGIENEKNEPHIKFISKFMNLVVEDIIKEEVDIMEEKGIVKRDIYKLSSNISKDWYMRNLNE